jgi:hypothetical protein
MASKRQGGWYSTNLTNGMESDARFSPMSSAEFGAESGAYFLISRPNPPISLVAPEYLAFTNPSPKHFDQLKGR